MEMKIRVAAAALALAAVIFGCSQQGQKASASYYSRFHMDWVGSSGAFDIYRDRETGVQYIIYSEAETGSRSYSGIIPRYNADGTLYTEG